MRIGFGYDVHRLVADRPLILGGVVIPSDFGLDGHSDADVLLHAMTDAILGAAAMGDIGQHFPDTDPEWKGADSAKLLEAVVDLVSEKGFRVGNVDATVVLEAPKIRPHVDAIRDRVSSILRVKRDQVSVKATTSEGMGFVGVKQGAAAYAICLLIRVASPEANE